MKSVAEGDPRRFLPLVRRFFLFAIVAVVLYLPWRYRVVTMPEGAASPLVEVAAGERLLVDKHPPAFAARDIVLFEHEGALLLGRVVDLPDAHERAAWPDPWRARADAGALWIHADRADVLTSAGFGPLPRDRVRGRVVMVW